MNRWPAEYLAGVFDVRGNFDAQVVAKHRSGGAATHSFIQVSMVLANQEFLNELQKQFGGRIRTKSTGSLLWTVTNQSARLFLQYIYPCLRLRKVEAALVLAFQRTIDDRPRTKLSDDVLAQRRQLVADLRKMKKLRPKGANVG